MQIFEQPIAMHGENSVLMETINFEQFWNTLNCIYLLKLYDKSIIILLTNKLYILTQTVW